MKVKTKKFFVLLLAILLTWQILPFQVLAEPPGPVISDSVTLQGNLGGGVRGGAPVYHTVHFKDHDDTPLHTAYNVLDGTRLDSIELPAQ